MNKTRIEWCDSTWNPVTGCLHGCEYCYARKIANRFGTCESNSSDVPESINELLTKDYGVIVELNERLQGEPYPYNFVPTFHKYRLDEPARKTKGQNIFVCSMADLFGEWVPDEWIEEVFKACEKAPQHNYLFLTKNPDKYKDLYNKKAFPYSKNIWLGTTITTPNDKFVWFKDVPYKSFVSIEPILEPFGKLLNPNHFVDWVIIGAETGKRKNKVVPKKEWIDSIVEQCREVNVPIFMKDSLIPIMGEENMLREFPEGLRR
jgi:protein gp37